MDNCDIENFDDILEQIGNDIEAMFESKFMGKPDTEMTRKYFKQQIINYLIANVSDKIKWEVKILGNHDEIKIRILPYINKYEITVNL